MSTLRRTLQDLSHSVRGIRNGCILLVSTGILMAIGAHLSLYHPSPADPIRSIYFLHLHLQEQQENPRNPLEELNPELFEDDTLQQQWTEILEQGESGVSNDLAKSPGIRFGLGLHALRNGNRKEALIQFDLENQHHPNPFVRRILLLTALRSNDPVLTDQWFNQPDYVEDSRGELRFDLGRRRRDWGMMFDNFLPMEAQRVRPDALFLTLVAGLIWSTMLAGLYSGPKNLTTLLWVPVAVGLGWISTWPTIFSGIWLDGRYGLSEGDTFLVGLAYFLVSVGLREELCKLLLFAPLLVITVRRNRDSEALILGALVGLGFAIEENMGYFQPMSSGVMISRFISANILHFTLTGATSLALTRMVRDPGRWMGDSLQVIGTAIGLHAIYNALLTHPVPGLGDMSYFHGTALVGCCYLFFREAYTLCPPRPGILSLTSIFCWGFCLLFNLELVHAAAAFPLPYAMALSGIAAISSVLSGYVFLHVMREPLSH